MLDVALPQVHVDAVEIVGPKGAALATLLPIGREHEMIDSERMPAVEQLRKRLPARRSGDDILLVDPHPRQIAAPLTEPVAQSGNFLLLSEQMRAGREPFLMRH